MFCDYYNTKTDAMLCAYCKAKKPCSMCLSETENEQVNGFWLSVSENQKRFNKN